MEQKNKFWLQQHHNFQSNSEFFASVCADARKSDSLHQQNIKKIDEIASNLHHVASVCLTLHSPNFRDSDDVKEQYLEMKLREESEFCPVTCPLTELDREIAAAGHLGLHGNESFLKGVLHARLILAASINPQIAR